MPLIEARDLSKSFRIPSVRRDTIREHFLDLFRKRPTEELKVLQGVSLKLNRGESLGVMGRNGSGKSTLLKILAGIFHADEGFLRVQAPVTPILELGVGWNPELDAEDNILLIGTVMGLRTSELRGMTPKILEFAGLERFLHLELKYYSSGMASRLAFAVAFMAVREILILDEIFAVGDAEFKVRCRERMTELQERGHSIILVSHNPADISDFCGRALLLEEGKIMCEGSGAKVAAAYEGLMVSVDG